MINYCFSKINEDGKKKIIIKTTKTEKKKNLVNCNVEGELGIILVVDVQPDTRFYVNCGSVISLYKVHSQFTIARRWFPLVIHHNEASLCILTHVQNIKVTIGIHGLGYGDTCATYLE